MVRKYFGSANTAAGYTNLVENNLAGIKRVYALVGVSKKQKTQVLKDILRIAEKKHSTVEAVMSPLDIEDIDAVIIRDIKIAIVDKDCISDKMQAETIELANEKAAPWNKIKEASSKEAWALGQLYEAYQNAKIIHDEWEKIYMQNMDYPRLEAYEESTINTLFNNRTGSGGTQNYHRFFGASTPDGSVNYIDNLTENLKARYFIKGRPGTGKSTFLKRLAADANRRGFDTEIYYCSFDKNSLDMVIVPELKFCVFDSTAPHEMFPKSERDIILDFYKEAGLSGIDERFCHELADVSERYANRIAEGIAYLRLGKLYYKEREEFILRNCDSDKFEKSKSELVNKILGT